MKGGERGRRSAVLFCSLLRLLRQRQKQQQFLFLISLISLISQVEFLLSTYRFDGDRDRDGWMGRVVSYVLQLPLPQNQIVSSRATVERAFIV